MCPSFCPTKTTKHFSPLAVLVQHWNMHRCCGITQAGGRQRCIYSAFFFQRILPIFANYFFPISSICSPLLYLYKKAQTTTFLIKFLTVLFFSFTYFSYFSWGMEDILLFYIFFLQGLAKTNSRVWRGPDWLIFAIQHGVWQLLMLKSHFSLGHVTPHCWSHLWIFMGVFSGFHKLKQWLVAFLSAQAGILNFVF